MSLLIGIGAFLLALTVLIAFHELGHYWVARVCGVRVLCFSVGFGRPLWTYQSKRTGTRWVLARWPLGGYVKMLDRREPGAAKIPEAMLAQEFTGKPLYQRTLIIAAGPVFNFILAFLLYAMVFWTGETGLRPIIGHVQQESPAAQAGLQVGDEILEISGKVIQSWPNMVVPLLDSGMNSETIELQVRTREGFIRERQLELPPNIMSHENIVGILGFEPMRATSTPVIGVVQDNAPAAIAGLQVGDRVLRLEDQTIESWRGLVEAVHVRAGQQVELELEREGQRLEVDVRLGYSGDSGATVGYLGVSPYFDEVLHEELRVVVHHPLGRSLVLGVERTWEFGVLTLQLLGHLLIGEASVRNVSGPVGIASFAVNSAMAGLSAFLSMMALLSLSLGILNLLPIPILDGGHLVWCAVEAVTGRPISEALEAVGQRVGFAMLCALMLLALYNDFVRLFG